MISIKKTLSRIWILIFLVFLASCFSVHYSTTGASISPEVKTCTVRYFQNRAPNASPVLAQQLTDRLREKIQNSTRLTMLTDGGDVFFEGEIIGYDVTPQAVQSNDKAAQNRLTVTVRVDDNGQFSVNVPVNDNGVNLTIEAEPFEYNQIQAFGSNSNNIKKFYTAAPVIVSVSTTHAPVVEVFYTATTPAFYVEKVKINVTVEAELNNSITGNEKVANQRITLHNSGWAQEYTTDDNGEFTAVVPANQNIFYTISFEYDKTVPDGLGYKQENYKYEVKSGYVGNFASESDVTLDLGGGVPVP